MLLHRLFTGFYWVSWRYPWFLLVAPYLDCVLPVFIWSGRTSFRDDPLSLTKFDFIWMDFAEFFIGSTKFGLVFTQPTAVAVEPSFMRFHQVWLDLKSFSWVLRGSVAIFYCFCFVCTGCTELRRVLLAGRTVFDWVWLFSLTRIAFTDVATNKRPPVKIDNCQSRTFYSPTWKRGAIFCCWKKPRRLWCFFFFRFVSFRFVFFLLFSGDSTLGFLPCSWLKPKWTVKGTIPVFLFR